MSFRWGGGAPVPEGVVDKRDAILRAAGKVFAERGYHATAISDIARELGAGHGTFYRYFRNKEDIARGLVAKALDRVMEALADEDPRASRTLAQYREQVRRIGHRLFDLVGAEPDLCRILFYDAATLDRADPALTGRSMETAAAYTAEFIANGQARGFLRADVDAHVVGLAVNGMILTGAMRLLHVPDPEGMREPWIRVVETLMFDGLGA
jgi:AcrR family transcriptional regulator